MLFYYVRHGEPIYDPDMLTDYGKVQAEAAAERLKNSSLCKIFASTSRRAYETAAPTARETGLEANLLDFANEHYTWLDFSVEKEDKSGNHWCFHDSRLMEAFTSPEVLSLGDRWFDAKSLSPYREQFSRGVERVYRESDALLASLGYEHCRYTGRYKAVNDNDDRVALFAHQGFGLIFLSCLLDIPYPRLCAHFDMCHTGITVIEFKKRADSDICIPKMLTLSNEAHLYVKELHSDFPKL